MASARAGGVVVRGERSGQGRTHTLTILQPRLREGDSKDLVSGGTSGRADGGDLRYNEEVNNTPPHPKGNR